MAQLPGGTILVINQPLSGEDITLVVEDISYTVTYEKLDRNEFDNSKQASARNGCGQPRMTGTNLTGKPYQIVIQGCNDDESVQLGPNSDSDYANIKKKFRIKHYQVTGALSENVDVELLRVLAVNHQDRLAKFEYYQDRVNGDAPYATLQALQAESFSYLTATGTEILGTAIDTVESDVLITAMSANIGLAIATDDTGDSYEYYKSFTISFEIRTLADLDDLFTP